MGKRYDGDDFQSATFTILRNKPIDDRFVVRERADLLLESTWKNEGDTTQRTYSGMVVSVTNDATSANNGVYWLKNIAKYNKQAWDSTADNYDADGWSLISGTVSDASVTIKSNDNSWTETFTLNQSDGKTITLPITGDGQLKTVDTETLSGGTNDIGTQDGYYYPNAIQDADGNWYGAVVIGRQVWMAENLRTTKYADGTDIAFGNTTMSDSVAYYYHPNGDSQYDEQYGLLYNAPAVMNGESYSSANPSGVQGIAFDNWHVPSASEVTQLLTYVGAQDRFRKYGNSNLIAESLSSQKGWRLNGGGSLDNIASMKTHNKTGFNGVPAGVCSATGVFGAFGVNMKMWTVTELSDGILGSMELNYTYNLVEVKQAVPQVALTVRCVSDFTPELFRAWYVKEYGTMQHHIAEDTGGVLWVNFTKAEHSNGTMTADVSYEDVLEAYNNNIEIVGIYQPAVNGYHRQYTMMPTSNDGGTTLLFANLSPNGANEVLFITMTASDITLAIEKDYMIPDVAGNDGYVLTANASGDAVGWTPVGDVSGEVYVTFTKAEHSNGAMTSSVPYADIVAAINGGKEVIGIYQPAVSGYYRQYVFTPTSNDGNVTLLFTNMSPNDANEVMFITMTASATTLAIEKDYMIPDVADNGDKVLVANATDDSVEWKAVSEISTAMRTMNHEQLTDSTLGDINIHDGYYFPNAVQDADGNWYGAVVIGDQVWMGENLKCTSLPDGTPIVNGSAFVNDGNFLYSASTPYYYIHDDENHIVNEAGLLYNIAAYMNGGSTTEDNPSGVQGIAPSSWHIPSSSECSQLLDYITNQTRYSTTKTSDTSYSTTAIIARDSLPDEIFNGYDADKKATINATGFNAYSPFATCSGITISEDSEYPGSGADFIRFSAVNNNFRVMVSHMGYSLTPQTHAYLYGQYVRCVSDLSPVQFRNWYVNTYGSMQHHLDNGIEPVRITSSGSTYTCEKSSLDIYNLLAAGKKLQFYVTDANNENFEGFLQARNDSSASASGNYLSIEYNLACPVSTAYYYDLYTVSYDGTPAANSPVTVTKTQVRTSPSLENYSTTTETVELIDDRTANWLCFKAGTGGGTVAMVSDLATKPNLQYSTDKVNWTNMVVDSASGGTSDVLDLAADEKVYLRGNNPSGLSDGTNHSVFVMTGTIYGSGNVNSILFNDDNNSETLPSNAFNSLFNSCTSLVTPPSLPSKNLGNSCYASMFYGCTAMTSVPELPATNLTNSCYSSMFFGCTSITETMELPATQLTSYCYYWMFRGCSNLETIKDIAATSIVGSSLYGTFSNCVKITETPVLKFDVIPAFGCQALFYGCTMLSKITCLATTIAAPSGTTNWTYNVAASGTFYKAASMTGWSTGDGGIPSGWTVRNYGVTNYNDLDDKPLPDATAADNGKILMVVDGEWSAVSVPVADSILY